jgi:hypothetical protein
MRDIENSGLVSCIRKIEGTGDEGEPPWKQSKRDSSFTVKAL